MKIFQTKTPTPITKYKLLEVERISPLPELNAELKESMRTLQLHPGFNYILSRLRLTKSGLQHQLQEGFELPERDLHRIQAGIFFAGWLENELRRLTSTPSRPVRDLTDSEAESFLDISSFDANLERVG